MRTLYLLHEIVGLLKLDIKGKQALRGDKLNLIKLIKQFK